MSRSTLEALRPKPRTLPEGSPGKRPATGSGAGLVGGDEEAEESLGMYARTCVISSTLACIVALHLTACRNDCRCARVLSLSLSLSHTLKHTCTRTRAVLSSSHNSSSSQSSRSWSFPAYQGPPSPSLSAGSFSATSSPYRSTATSQELDSILGPLGGGGRMGGGGAGGGVGAKASGLRALGGVGGGGRRLRGSADGVDSGYSSVFSSLHSLR